MKMKKYLLFGFATLAMAVSCTEFRNEDPVEILPSDETPTVSLVETTADGVYSMTATITAPEGTTYYSYLVAEGEADASYTASALYSLTYSGLDQAAVKYATTPTTTLDFEDLSPDVTYTLYAVAGNEQGFTSEVATTSIKISNQETPAPSSFSYSNGVMSVTFSEPITLASDAVVTASVYAQSTFVEEVEITTDGLSVDGSTLNITAPEVYAAAYVYFTWDEGIVVNSASTSAPAYSGSSIVFQETPVNFDLYIGTKDDNGDFVVDENGDYVEADGSTIYFSSNSDVVALFTDGTEIDAYGTGGATYTIYESGKTVTYTLTAGTDYGLAESYTTVTAFFPEEPTYGATASISFDAGAFVDVYGNISNAISTGDIYYRSRSLDADCILGTYTLAGVSYWDGYLDEGAVVTISSTTEGSETTYTMEGLCYGTGSAVTITFNEHSGTISIADWQEISTYNYDGVDYPIYFANADDYDDVTFDYVDADTFTSSDKWWGYYIDSLGWYEVYETATLSRVEVSSDSATTSSVALPVRDNFVETRFINK